MKALLKIIMLASLLMGLPNVAWAQFNDRLFPIVELTDDEVAQIDMKDGSVEDWRQVVGEPTLTAADFRTDPERGSYDPADMDFRIWLAWHRASSHIYVAMERSDDVYVNEFDAASNDKNAVRAFQDSYLSFYVDGDHSGGQFFFGSVCCTSDEETLLLNNQQAQWYESIGEVHGNSPNLYMANSGDFADWFQIPPYGDGGGGVVKGSPAISVTEFYVTPFDRFIWNSPESSVLSDLQPGKIIGFAMGTTDVEPEPARFKSWHYLRAGEVGQDCGPDLSSTLVVYCADGFASGLLLGPGGTFPEGSAVESLTWARIKASFGK
jgi:hypothetical protein